MLSYSSVFSSILDFIRKKKRIAYGLMAFSLLLFLLALPEIFSKSFYNPPQLEKTIKQKLESSQMAISYDGLTYSFYRGVHLYRLRISADKDFNRGRIAVFSKKVRIVNPIWKSTKQISLVMEQVVLNLYKEAEQEKTSLASLGKLFPASENFLISINNAQVNFFLRENPYRKTKLTISNASGVLQKENGLSKISVKYSDSIWGTGNLESDFFGCFPKECDLSKINLVWEGKDLRLNAFQWWYPEYFAKQGTLSGHLKIFNDNPKDNNSGYKVKYDIALWDLKLEKEGMPFWNVPQFSMQGDFTESKKGYTLKGNGDYLDQNFSLYYDSEKKSIWPRSLVFSLEPLPKEIHLPGNFSISGLKKFSLKLKKENQNLFDINLEIKKGVVKDYNLSLEGVAFTIPVASFIGTQDNLKTNIQAIRGNSDLNLSLTGPVSILRAQFRKIAFPINVGYTGKPQDVIAFRSRFHGLLKSNSFYISDWIAYRDYFLRMYNKNVITGLRKNWVPSRLRDRRFFIQYLMHSYIVLDMKFENVFFSPKDQYSLAGQLEENGVALRVNLNDKDGNINIRLGADYASNIPYFQGELEYQLYDGKKVLDPYLNPTLFNSFGKIKSYLKFNTSGERPADFYLDLRSWGNIEIENVVLGSLSDENNLPKKWNRLNIKYNRVGTLGQILNINGESEKYILTGYGKWSDVNLISQYSLQTNLKQKKPL